MYETTWENGTPITKYAATGIAEGFIEIETATDEIRAWSYLIGTRLAYNLQGWFGRTATAIIESGKIEADGTVNWDLFNFNKQE